MKVENVDNMLYGALYGRPRVGDINSLWNETRENKELLKEAIKKKRDKFDERNTIAGTMIGKLILSDYENVDKEIYSELVNLIYTDEDISRIVIGGASNGGTSYLLLTIMNDLYVLTEEQKAFAVKEAMNKIGTVKYKEIAEARQKELEKQNITDDETVLVQFGGQVNPCGKKTAIEYFGIMLDSIGTDQAHGTGAFDIRYWILRNPNWCLEEKKELIYDFYADENDYDENFDEWQWAIINEYADTDTEYELDICSFDDYTYEDLLDIFKDKNKANDVLEEIEFIRTMKKLRKPNIYGFDDFIETKAQTK